MEASVSDIHCYPSRPHDFVEPLFATQESRSEIAEHLLRASWLSRASGMPEKSGSIAHCIEETVQLQRYAGGHVEIVRTGVRRCSWRRRRIVEVLMRWRDVRWWWSDEDQVDRLLFRVIVSGHSSLGGAVVDLALDRSGEWTLVGIVD
ncbi:MAG: hypothetical protein WA982_04115 [Rubrobacteraceae bacterium]